MGGNPSHILIHAPLNLTLLAAPDVAAQHHTFGHCTFRILREDLRDQRIEMPYTRAERMPVGTRITSMLTLILYGVWTGTRSPAE